MSPPPFASLANLAAMPWANSAVPGLEALQGAAALCPLIIFTPLLAFLVISFATHSRGEASALVCGLSFLVSLGASLAVFGQQLQGSGVFEEEFVWLAIGEPTTAAIKVGFLVDPLSALTASMVCLVALLVAVYSHRYMTVEISHFPTQDSSSLARFYGYLSLFVFSMLGLVFSNNLLQIYIFWELVGVCSYFLIGFWYFKTSAAKANLKSFVVTKFSDLFFLMGILAVGVGAGTFRFTELNMLESWSVALFGSAALPLILIAFGPMGKSAQVPLHVWLPDAMEGPTPVSALIHAATMVAAGIYLIARLFGLYQLVPAAGLFVAVVGGVTALVAALIAVAQNDIKRVLAYSTISQLGFMLAALGSGAYTAGLFHLFTHAFFKALLFLGAGAVLLACHNADIWRMGGLAKTLPRTHATFLIGCLALAGVPPLAGFWSKDEIFAGVAHSPAILALLIAAAFLTAFYVTRMYCVAFLGKFRGDAAPVDLTGPVPGPELTPPLSPSRDGLGIEPEWTEARAKDSPTELPPACLGALSERVSTHHGPPHEVPHSMTGPLMLLAFFAAFLGFAGIPDGMFGEQTNLFHRILAHPKEPAHDFSWVMMLGSVVIAGAGIALGYALYGRDPVAGERKLRTALGGFHRALRQKLYFDHLWAWFVAKVVFGFSKVCAVIDDFVIDFGVRGTAALTYLFGSRMQKEQTGQIAHYLFMLVASLLLLTALVATISPDFALSPAKLFYPNRTAPGEGILP